jgi:lysophospholipid hydrolase
VVQFAGKLKSSLEDLGASTSYLDQGIVMRHLGRHAFARIGKLKVAGWLADQEQHYRTVLYVADAPPSSQWTLTCIRQADLILVVAMGDEPGLGEYEKLLLATKTTARKELILLHDERTVPPGSTRPWLKVRLFSQDLKQSGADVSRNDLGCTRIIMSNYRVWLSRTRHRRCTTQPPWQLSSTSASGSRPA